MEIKIKSTQILQVLNIISWMIFVGICIDAGGFLTNTIYATAVSPNVASHFWGNLNLSELYNYDSGQFLVVTSYLIIVTVLKALLFFLIVKVLYDKKLNLKQPFNTAIGKFIFNMSYISLFIGLFSIWGKNYIQWIESKNITMPSIELLKIGGGDVWIFMGIVLLIIGFIFKRGIEIQQENDLTI